VIWFPVTEAESWFGPSPRAGGRRCCRCSRLAATCPGSAEAATGPPAVENRQSVVGTGSVRSPAQVFLKELFHVKSQSIVARICEDPRKSNVCKHGTSSRNGRFSSGRHVGIVWGVTNSHTVYVGDCGQGEKRKPDGVRTRIDYTGGGRELVRSQ